MFIYILDELYNTCVYVYVELYRYTGGLRQTPAGAPFQSLTSGGWWDFIYKKKNEKKVHFKIFTRDI